MPAPTDQVPAQNQAPAHPHSQAGHRGAGSRTKPDIGFSPPTGRADGPAETAGDYPATAQRRGRTAPWALHRAGAGQAPAPARGTHQLPKKASSQPGPATCPGGGATTPGTAPSRECRQISRPTRTPWTSARNRPNATTSSRRQPGAGRVYPNVTPPNQGPGRHAPARSRHLWPAAAGN